MWLRLLDSLLEGPTKELRGQFGEDDVNALFVYYSRKRKIHYKLLGNIHIKVSDDKYIQIDTIYINSNGVFVTEIKNWSGYIKGKASDPIWTVTRTRYGQRHVYESKNPLIQNDYHTDTIRKELPPFTPIHSLVVFASNNASHLKIDNVIGIGSLPKYLEEFESDTKLSDEEIDNIFNYLYTKYKKRTH